MQTKKLHMESVPEHCGTGCAESKPYLYSCRKKSPVFQQGLLHVGMTSLGLINAAVMTVKECKVLQSVHLKLNLCLLFMTLNSKPI